MQDVGADVQVALATGSGPLLPANNAFRATVRQRQGSEASLPSDCELTSGEELVC